MRFAEYVEMVEAREAGEKPWRESAYFRHPMTLQTEAPCGCKIVGDNVLQYPMCIQFCAMHAAVEPSDAPAADGDGGPATGISRAIESAHESDPGTYPECRGPRP